jgi:hypothetical protein
MSVHPLSLVIRACLALAVLFSVPYSLLPAAWAGVTYTGAPGLTAVYVRVSTSATASVAVALAEGTGAGVGFYTVSDADLVTAGLNSAGTYSFKVFSGSPSTTANDTLLATGVLPWSGSVEIGAPANVVQNAGTNITASAGRQEVNATHFGGTAGTFSGGRPEVNVTHISGDSTAADNAERFFDGTGYGPLLKQTDVNSPTSNTLFTISSGPTNDDALNGALLWLTSGTTQYLATITDYQGSNKATTVSWHNTTPTVVGGEVLAIVSPAFGGPDRTSITTIDDFLDTEVAAIKAKTDSLTFTVANEVNANTRYWTGGLIPAQNITGVPEVDITHVQGEEASAVSGAIDVNVVKLIGNEIQLTPP